MRAFFEDGRHYYKYEYQDWTQPKLTGNEIFINDFLAKSNYNAFYSNTGTIRLYVDEKTGWIRVQMQTNKPFIATKFTFHVASQAEAGSDANGNAYKTSFEGSNNGVDWVTIGTSPTVKEGKNGTIDMSSNTTPYTYFKLNTRNGGKAYDDLLVISKLRLYGKMREIVEGTSSDYDFYRDIKSFMTLESSEPGQYRLIKSYKKGQILNLSD